MRVHLRVRGRVQGVGYRWFVREAARKRRIAGWVKNLPDGCVEVEAAGEAASLQDLVASLREGPPGARVDDIIEQPSVQNDELPQPFMIIR